MAVPRMGVEAVMVVATVLPSTLISHILTIRQESTLTPTPTLFHTTTSSHTSSATSSTSTTKPSCTTCASFLVAVILCSIAGIPVLAVVAYALFYLVFFTSIGTVYVVTWIGKFVWNALVALWGWSMGRVGSMGGWAKEWLGVVEGKRKVGAEEKRKREEVELERKRGVVGTEAIV